MSSEEELMVSQLLEATRLRIAAGDRDNALAALINAICLTRGEDKVIETLQAAKQREERKVTRDAHAGEKHTHTHTHTLIYTYGLCFDMFLFASLRRSG